MISAKIKCLVLLFQCKIDICHCHLNLFRETQADESDCEGEPDNVADDPSQPSAINQIELLQQQLSDIQAELHNANEQLKKSKQKAAEEANAAIKIISE